MLLRDGVRARRGSVVILQDPGKALVGQQLQTPTTCWLVMSAASDRCLCMKSSQGAHQAMEGLLPQAARVQLQQLFVQSAVVPCPPMWCRS
jgi:hypothetical protein